MKKNTRVSASINRNLRGDGRIPLFYPMAASFIGHLIFLAVFVFTPGMKTETKPLRSVINVSMVSFKKADVPATEKSVVKKRPTHVKKPDVVKRPTPVEPSKKKETVVKPKPKPKTSLKKKTFKSTEVVKHALKEIEKEPETPAQESSQPDALKSALDRLKKQVGEKEKTDASNKSAGSTGTQSGRRTGGFNEGGKKEAELIDLYRLEIAFQIQKNWAFNDQLAGGDPSLAAAIVFKVMPDGEIRDLFFTDRSGNTHLDESAYRAIMKSNPVDSHPRGLKQPYVVMAIRFTPQGIR